MAQVTITVATGGESMCLNPGPATSDYYTLSDIVITENAVNDFNSLNNTNEYIDLQFSAAGFEFDNTSGFFDFLKQS